MRATVPHVLPQLILPAGFCRVSAYQLPCATVISNKNALFRSCGLTPTKLSELASGPASRPCQAGAGTTVSIKMPHAYADSNGL
jgi:hypothetical protein